MTPAFPTLRSSDLAILLLVERTGDTLGVEVRDEGPVFAPDTLAQLGRPYHSTKGRPGGGLGLFLVTNVMRKLGGRVSARNRKSGGAAVRIDLPIAGIAFRPKEDRKSTSLNTSH